MNGEDITKQYIQAVKYKEWILEFDPDINVGFDDDEFEFETDKES